MAELLVSDAFLLLKHDGVYWAAGQRGGNRLINSVNITEIPDCYEWFQKGEMVLTTLYPYNTMDEKIKFIKNLNEAEVACLGIHPGKHESFDLPEYLKVLADSFNFPIFIFDRKVPYSRIIKKIYEYLLNKEQIALKKEKEINTAMNQILLSKGGIKEIIGKLADIINLDVYLLDENFKVMETSTKKHSNIRFQNLLPDLQTRLRKNVDKLQTILYEDHMAIVLAVNINKYVKNFLIAFGKRPLTDKKQELCEIAFMSAATALKMDILKTLSVIEAEQKLKQGFFDDVMSGYYDDEFLQDRAKALGLNIFEKNFVIVIDFNFKNNLPNKTIHKDIESLIRDSFGSIKSRIILSIKKSKEWIFLIGFKNKECKGEMLNKEILNHIFKNIQDEFCIKKSPISIYIGVSSGITKIVDLKRGYKEARFAIEMGNKIFDNNNVIYYDDLGIYKLISIPDKVEDILVDNVIRDIYEYDKDKNGNLLETLEKYLDFNGSIKDAAEKLYVHPNTVKYRMKRIKEITGEDLFNDDQKRLYYHIMVKALKILI
ncbi:MAG TPA: hypothetical protein GX534_00285 [Thermoanaerobacterales bacterium]|nr:hypothetical protein [Thermoanaerobacterales bacterium]